MSKPTTYLASAPGSLMLLGEHAVLYGKSAIVGAINQRIYVAITPRTDRWITVYSDGIGHCGFALDELNIEPPFDYVLAAIKIFKDKLSCGFDLTIRSDFSSSLGLGSSAAVTVATVAGLMQFLHEPLDQTACFQYAKQAVQWVNPHASAADVAASVVGGVLHFQSSHWLLLAESLPITVIYTGNKVPTPVVVADVAQHYQQDQVTYQRYFDTLQKLVDESLPLLVGQNYSALGEIFTAAQEIYVKMHLSTPLIDNLVLHVNQLQGIHGVKLSGSGLGDCIVGLGKLDASPAFDVNEQRYGVKQLIVDICSQGVRSE